MGIKLNIKISKNRINHRKEESCFHELGGKRLGFKNKYVLIPQLNN
jgi:hypothetical protein